MNRKLWKKSTVFLGLSVVSLMAITAMACSSEKPAVPTRSPETVITSVATSEGVRGGASETRPSTGGSTGFSGMSSGIEALVPVNSGIPVRSPSLGFAQEHQNPTGLWINGVGELSVSPDVAILSLGVESRAKTVAEASGAAASAMNRIIDSAKANGVAARDISTQHFNIQPEYRWIEVKSADGNHGKQELTGYIVTNTAAVKVRALDNVGKVIDAAVVAGRDLVRVNDVQFTVEDTVKYAAEMRELAAKDALAKASIYARALGVKVGGVIYIAELGSQAPVVQKDMPYARMRMAAAESAPTPISADTLKLTASVQVVFSIQ